MVARFRERVLAALGDRVERIVLFGSRARGDEHAESDWDVAVFFDHDPSEREQGILCEVASAVESEFATRIQSIAPSGQLWLATDELSCNIRDHGRVAYGPAEIPMIERPVLQHARVAWSRPRGSPSRRVRRYRRPTKPSSTTAAMRRQGRLVLRRLEPVSPPRAFLTGRLSCSARGAARDRAFGQHQSRPGGQNLQKRDENGAGSRRGASTRRPWRAPPSSG